MAHSTLFLSLPSFPQNPSPPSLPFFRPLPFHPSSFMLCLLLSQLLPILSSPTILPCCSNYPTPALFYPLPSSPCSFLSPTFLTLLLSILYLPHPAPFYPLPSSPCSFLSPTIPHISPLPYTIFPCFSHFLSPLKIVTSLPSPTSPYLSQSSVPGLYLYVG